MVSATVLLVGGGTVVVGFVVVVVACATDVVVVGGRGGDGSGEVGVVVGCVGARAGGWLVGGAGVPTRVDMDVVVVRGRAGRIDPSAAEVAKGAVGGTVLSGSGPRTGSPDRLDARLVVVLSFSRAAAKTSGRGAGRSTNQLTPRKIAMTRVPVAPRTKSPVMTRATATLRRSEKRALMGPDSAMCSATFRASSSGLSRWPGGDNGFLPFPPGPAESYGSR